MLMETIKIQQGIRRGGITLNTSTKRKEEMKANVVHKREQAKMVKIVRATYAEGAIKTLIGEINRCGIDLISLQETKQKETLISK